LRFPDGGRVTVTGAAVAVTVGGVAVPQWQSLTVPAGGVLDVGMLTGPGMRCYVLVAGGLVETEYLGSAATFTMGTFGGHDGRAVRVGDVLTVGDDPGPHESRPDRAARAAIDEQPSIGHRWEIAVTEGPHGAPEFFTRADIDTVIGTDYTVHFNSDRTGVRLVGPKPQWARADGGEAGLHPSNIHDNAYCVGALDFTGDTPILLGPDGPSLGGFVCPVTVVGGDRWKLGQMAPGDAVRFVPVRADRAPSLRTIDVNRRASFPLVISTSSDHDDGVLTRFEAVDGTTVTLRRAGDGGVLVEYGPMTLDLAMRARVHVLHEHLMSLGVAGITEITPGVRSLQVQFDPAALPMADVVDLLARLDGEMPPSDRLVVPSRTVRLPLSWDDPATHEAIQRYMHGVRADAPWCPWNIEFIRRINGLADVEAVHDIVYDAQYLVLGLGDVYLGAPVATPLDPRHRLVTTKYNPARTWTPENAVGIGGAYLCIYGMEGPGGYQFVGRTTQVWNHRHPRDAGSFEPGTPWLLRYFDRISFYPVSAEELLDLRADMAAGRGDVDIATGEFSLAAYTDFLAAEADPIAAFRQQQSVAFNAERLAWDRAGEVQRAS
jgi:urea carboxylase